MASPATMLTDREMDCITTVFRLVIRLLKGEADEEHYWFDKLSLYQGFIIDLSKLQESDKEGWV